MLGLGLLQPFQKPANFDEWRTLQAMCDMNDTMVDPPVNMVALGR